MVIMENKSHVWNHQPVCLGAGGHTSGTPPLPPPALAAPRSCPGSPWRRDEPSPARHGGVVSQTAQRISTGTRGSGSNQAELWHVMKCVKWISVIQIIQIIHFSSVANVPVIDSQMLRIATTGTLHRGPWTASAFFRSAIGSFCGPTWGRWDSLIKFAMTCHGEFIQFDHPLWNVKSGALATLSLLSRHSCAHLVTASSRIQSCYLEKIRGWTRMDRMDQTRGRIGPTSN